MAKSNDIRRRLATSDVSDQPSIPSKISKTIHYFELAEWQKDNEYILTGYRRLQNQWKGCANSVFAYLHNETINIHTHLWAAALFGYFLVTFNETHLQQYKNTTWADATVIAVFLSSAIFCLLGSASFHTFTCHSLEVSTRCHAVDYAGIVILTVGSFYPSLYFGFFCQPQLQIFYIAFLSLIGVGAAYTVLHPEYAKPTHRGARTAVFIGLGLSGVGPITHCILIEGYRKVIFDLGFGWVVFSGALYIFGALLYANRIPERFAPGKFDYFFASHQIFHCCVVAAAGAHYAGVLTALNYSYSTPNICVVPHP
ncbi:hemolysin-III related-domain-containing protein [Roridomyces roridus]|uniref:Hemolysin-III related-domain-containing protein n=1 Tax=Roridomyces roridus TaxID=1738132 RepID=A0AAD7BZ19_9AGAR|nr:hemolysin-III related-domain-containing protein [Roridomyces roridus]